MSVCAITGMGVASPIGIGIDDYWTACHAGISGIREIPHFDASRFGCRAAGVVAGLADSGSYRSEWQVHDRVTGLALTAAMDACAVSGIYLDQVIGVAVGTGVGGVSTHESECRKWVTGQGRVHPGAILRVMCNAPAAQISSSLKASGPSLTITTACAASLQAIGEAMLWVRDKRADAVVAGGAEAPLSEPLYAAWDSMRVLSRWKGHPGAACRPFSADRSGLVLAEAAGFVVLEDDAKARSRGATALGHVIGYATNTSSEHLTAPSVERETEVMRAAIESAGLVPTDIDYVQAHGTGTVANDLAEAKAIRAVFGAHADRLPVSSVKSIVGHGLGAAGVLGVITAILALRHRIAPPTMNLDTPDPAIDLNCVPNRAQSLTRAKHALINAFGFGGSNAALVVSAG